MWVDTRVLHRIRTLPLTQDCGCGMKHNLFELLKMQGNAQTTV